MPLDELRTLLGMFIDRILDEVFPDETGASRMQQIALFTLIFVLEGRGEPVTASRVAELTGHSYGQIHTHVQKLVKRGIIERTRIPNRLGRGQAWQLSIKHTPQTKKLLDALAKR
jgi:DNA-binding MarR family transcriptional regulator